MVASCQNPPAPIRRTIPQNERPAPIRGSVVVVEVVPPTSQVVLQPLASSVARKSCSVVVVEWNFIVVERNSI